jgi:hypothetical protein
VIAAAIALTPATAWAKGEGRLSGQLLGAAVPAKARGVVDVQAIRLDTGVVAATRRLGPSGLYEMKLAAGPYVLLANVVDTKAGTLRMQSSKALALKSGQRLPASVKIGVAGGKPKKAAAAYVQRSGKRTAGVRSIEVRDFKGARAQLGFLNRGLSGLLQRGITAAGGCRTALIANARQRVVIKSASLKVKRDLVLPDVTIDGTLSNRKAAVGYRLTVSETAGGKPLGQLDGQLRLGDGFFMRVDALGRELARVICNEPQTQPSSPTPPAQKPFDTTAPLITLTAPVHGSVSKSDMPELAGTAGSEPGDSPKVTVRVYAGALAVGLPVQTLTATRAAASAYSVNAASLPDGVYTARAEQSDAGGNTGLSSANTFTVAHDPTLIGAGDIAGAGGSTGHAATAALLAEHPDAIVYTLGDNAYVNGQPSEFAAYYDPTWGAHKARTRPIPGDHDTDTVPGGSPPNKGFSDYFAAQLAPFGETATNRLKSYYSYDVGAWHVVALNSTCYGNLPGCDKNAMEQWFRDDLAAHPNVCTIAMWHNARWSSGAVHGGEAFTQPLWQIAYDAGVDVVLSGNEHTYERFAPQAELGQLDPAYGVRQFVVGTGGYYLYALRPAGPLPNSEAFGSTYGVLKLTLRPTTYDWEFIPVAGQTFTDKGTGSCHGAPPP